MLDAKADFCFLWPADSFIDLMGRLQGLELEAGPAPLLNVVCGDPPPPFAERSFSLDDGPSKGEDQWELL